LADLRCDNAPDGQSPNSNQKGGQQEQVPNDLSDRKDSARKTGASGNVPIFSGSVDAVYLRSTKHIGEGGFGKVRIGKRKGTDEQYAIKEVRKKLGGGHAGRARGMPLELIMQEASAMYMLRHPNIIRLHGMYQDYVNVYMVMDYCDGGDLYDALAAASSFREKEAASLMQQILRGVNYMHHTGVCHRDLKPENFLVSTKGASLTSCCVKIIDFGCAWIFSGPDEVATRRMGTGRYMAPEMIVGSYTHRCDNWSCGVVTFAMLCGHYPFKDASVCQTQEVAFSQPDWKVVSEDAKTLIRHMLKKDPKQRYSAEQALAHPWIDKHAPAASDAPLPSSVLANLRTFCSGGVVRKAALNAIASTFKDQDLKKLQETFVRLDANQDGTLSMAELKQALDVAGGEDEAQRLRALMQGVDLDGDGRIDYREFIASTMERQQYQKESVCWQAFRKFDLDGNGSVSRQELRQVLESQELKGLLAGRSPDQVFEECDKNKDGKIQFEEFYDIIQGAE